jgi:hypothetical protein
MEDLKGKSILFFSPLFFNYEKEIKKKLEELGAVVTWFDDRPSNNFISKVFIRFNKNLISNKIAKYYDGILRLLKLSNAQFDFIFFLNPEAISVESLKKLKNEFSHAVFILYMWDSFQNRKNTAEFLPFFDGKFTFDPKDAEVFNLQLRPLFYIDLYVAKPAVETKYDLLFVGTAHTDRYNLVNRIVKPLSEKFRLQLYFFLGSKYLFWAKKIFDSDFKNVRYNDIVFDSLTHQSNSELIHSSKVILDVNHPQQIGLTMRTFETMGAKKKLITTNADVVNYDFYNKNNILIIDRLNPVIEESFFSTPFAGVDETLLYKYSIEGWIKEIFDLL